MTLLASALLAALVTVDFVAPDHYRDASITGGRGADDAVLLTLRQAFERLGERYLQADQTLAITVRDIDLAGEYEPVRRNQHNVRIVRDLYPPRIRLSYQLSGPGEPVASGDESLSDPMFMMNTAGYSAYDKLRYEKRLLDDWFRRRFATPAK